MSDVANAAERMFVAVHARFAALAFVRTSRARERK